MYGMKNYTITNFILISLQEIRDSESSGSERYEHSDRKTRVTMNVKAARSSVVPAGGCRTAGHFTFPRP